MGEIIFAGKKDVGRWWIHRSVSNNEAILEKAKEWLCLDYIGEFDKTGRKLIEVSEKCHEVHGVFRSL